MSNTIPIAYTDPCVLHSKERGFWQCGVWVFQQKDATVYPDRKEASDVRALRGLGLKTEIVPIKYVA